jgi:hypothetical protein
MSGRTVNSKHSCNSSSARTPEPTAASSSRAPITWTFGSILTRLPSRWPFGQGADVRRAEPLHGSAAQLSRRGLVTQIATPCGEPFPNVVERLTGDAVLGEVIRIQQVGLPESVSEDPPVEAAVGAFGEA